MTAATTTLLDVHVQDGRVWYAKDGGDPRVARDSVDEFVDNEAGGVDVARLVGMRQNADAVLRLVAAKQRGLVGDVLVCSPLACHTEAERRDPELVLFRMRNYVKAPSLGGFHQVTEDDHVSYGLASAMDAAEGAFTDKAEVFLRAHPAFRHLEFLSWLPAPAFARLLSTVIDPRWYVNPVKPDRRAKLDAFLGLNPRTQEGVTRPDARPWRRHASCLAVRNCWMGDQDPDEIMRNVSLVIDEESTDLPEHPVPGLRPGDFVWRRWAASLRFGRHAGNHTMAELRASQRLVAYVRHAWLSQLVGTSLPDGGQPLFRARDFFQYVGEADAYDHYILRR